MARLQACGLLGRALRGAGLRGEVGAVSGGRAWRFLSYRAPGDGGSQEEEVPEGEPEEVDNTSRMDKMVRAVVKVAVGVPLLYATMNVVTSMSDNWVRPAIRQVRCKDPFLQRSGASRLKLMAYNDDRRKFVVEAGAVPKLIYMLEMAPDDKTRRSAVEALANLVQCEAGVDAVRGVSGGEDVVRGALALTADSEVQVHIRVLLERMQGEGREKSRDEMEKLAQVA